MVHEKRIVDEFIKLNSMDSESFEEKEIAEYLKSRLEVLGLSVSEDQAKVSIGGEKSASNLYGFLKGNVPGEPILFCSHMDTVKPGKGKKVIIDENGTFRSDGTTVLGADDISGLVAILEALEVIQQNRLPHPDIEVLFCVAEEPYCEGSRYVDYSKLSAKKGYVLDLVGPIGRAAVSAPSIISVTVEITGKAAHAGFAPEQGINALNVAVEGLSKIPTGHTSENTTVNFGTIHGGEGKNIVPEKVIIQGEVRSLVHEEAQNSIQQIEENFKKAAKKLNADVRIDVVEHIRGYRVNEDSSVIKRLHAANEKLGFASEEIVTFGGSDANRLNENGIETVVLSCAMENVHSTSEYTSIQELKKIAELTLALMILKEN